MKDKEMKEKRFATYVFDTKNRLNTFFKHSSDDIKIPRNVEILLRENGSIGWDLVHNCWVKGQFTGVKDEFNDFVDYVCFTLETNPKNYTLKNHKEVVVLRNNALCLPDTAVIEWDADMRTENDISIYYQLVNSRNIPVIVANNDKVKRQVEKVFENIKAGVPCVISTDLLSQVEVKDIIDHDAISKMECLNAFNDVMIKRSLNWFGGTLDNKDKKAEITSKELEAYADYTTIGFLANYEERQSFCEEMKENGIDYKIVRNPIFADEPSDEEIESGEYELKEENENVDDEETERDLSDIESNKSTTDDDRDGE